MFTEGIDFSPYEEGYKAYLMQEITGEIAMNPYEQFTYEHTEWEKGRYSAQWDQIQL